MWMKLFGKRPSLADREEVVSHPLPPSTSIALYACYDKPSYVISSDIVIPIQGGAACADSRLPMLQDSEGDNISSKNPHFCELTVTYWIWKNSTAEVVGLFHYRRFLNLRNQLRKALIPDDHVLEAHDITRKRILEVLGRYDAILPCSVGSRGKSIRQHYAQRHQGSDLELCIDLIAEKYPEMAETAREVLDNSRSLGYFANVIVCRKALFDEYAAWLFDILFEVERRIHEEVLTRDAYEQRIYGFLSERLMSVFIAHKKKVDGLRVCEVPILQATDDPGDWARYLRKRRRHRFLMALGIRRQTWEECIEPSI